MQLEGSVGAPCGTGVGDCGIICSELDDATCQAGGARDTCTRIPRFGDFAWCESKRGTPTHKPLRTAAGLGGDGEVFVTKIRLR